MDRNENTAMPAVLKVPQLTHRTSCDVIVSGLVQIQVEKDGKGLSSCCINPIVNYTFIIRFIGVQDCVVRFLMTHYLMH